jgi:tetratricopeptide (TPR) repeat protein
MTQKKNEKQKAITTLSASQIETKAKNAVKDGKLHYAQECYQTLVDIDAGKYQSKLIEIRRKLLSELIAQKKWIDAERQLSFFQKSDPENPLIQKAQIQINLGLKNFENAAEIAAQWVADTKNVELLEGICIADALVLAFHPGNYYENLPVSVNDDLNSILAALSAIGSKSYMSALAHIRPIGIRSLFSDWKWLIKGICAFYNHEDSKALAAFDKLTNTSVPQKAGLPFRLLLRGTGAMEGGVKSPQLVRSLCILAGREDIAEPLTQAEYLWNEGHYCDSFQHLRDNLSAFPTQTSGLVSSLTSFYYSAFRQMPFDTAEDYLKYLVFEAMKKSDGHLFEKFKATQAMALWIEKEVEFDQEIIDVWEEVLGYFSGLADNGYDADTLIYLHLGELFSVEEPVEVPFDFSSLKRRNKRIQLRNAQLAELCYLKALKANANSRSAHMALLDLYEKIGDKSKINQTLDDIIKNFPNEKDALFKAGLRCVERKALVKGMKYLEQALLLDPIDQQLRENYIIVCVKAAFAYAYKGQKEKCIKTLQKAELKASPNKDDFSIGMAYLYVRWAVILYLMDDKSADGEQMFAKALSFCDDPLKLNYFAWLIGLCYEVPAKALKQINIFLEKILSASFDPQVGAALVHVLRYFLYFSPNNPDWLVFEIKRINNYLSEVARPNCTHEQARIIVEYALSENIHEIKVAQKYVNYILEKRPNDAHFMWFQFLCNFSTDNHPSKLVKRSSELQELITLAEQQECFDVAQVAKKVFLHMEGAVNAFEEFNKFYGEWEDDKLSEEVDYEDDDIFSIDESLDKSHTCEKESESANPQKQLGLFDFLDLNPSEE